MINLDIQSDSIDRTYIDTSHFNVSIEFPTDYAVCNSIVVKSADGLNPFVYTSGALHTQTFKFTCYVTQRQSELLQDLYAITMHPNYTDLRYPILVNCENFKNTMACYLYDYTPPVNIDYATQEFLVVTISLRPI